MAHDRGQSRQSLYREADQTVEAVEGTVAQARIERTSAATRRAAGRGQRARNEAETCRRDPSRRAARVRHHRSSRWGRPGSGPAVVAGHDGAETESSWGGRPSRPARRPARYSRCSTRRFGLGETGHRRRDSFRRRPILMVVEPERLCWPTGRLVEASDGVTRAEEFARFLAIEAVVHDDGSELGRGVKLERARRRAAGLPNLDDSRTLPDAPRRSAARQEPLDRHRGRTASDASSVPVALADLGESAGPSTASPCSSTGGADEGPVSPTRGPTRRGVVARRPAASASRAPATRPMSPNRAVDHVADETEHRPAQGRRPSPPGAGLATVHRQRGARRGDHALGGGRDMAGGWTRCLGRKGRDRRSPADRSSRISLHQISNYLE
jgi:hypothetical protein